MKRLITLLLAAILVIGVFAGCAAEEPAVVEEKPFDFGLDTSQAVELNIVGSIENFEALEAVIAKFELAYSNCHITYSYLDDYNNVIEKRLENDLSGTSMFMSSQSNFADSEYLCSLAVDYYDYDNAGISLDATNRLLTDAQQLDGKLYTVPMATVLRGMVVNTTLLAEHGLSMPTNYAEFIEACRVLKEAGIIPIQANAKYYGNCMFYPLIANSVVHSENYETALGEINSYSEGSGKYYAEAFEKLEYLVSQEYIVAGETEGFKDNYDEAILNFFNGDVAFFPCTAETVSGMAKREERSDYFTQHPFDYEFTCCPVGDEGAYCYWQAWSGLSINKNSDNENWSRAFLNFLLEKENLALLAEVKGMPANTAEATTDKRFASLFSVDEQFITETSKFKINVYSQLNNSMIGIVVPDESGELFDAESAMANYELQIAEKRAEADSES